MRRKSSSLGRNNNNHNSNKHNSSNTTNSGNNGQQVGLGMTGQGRHGRKNSVVRPSAADTSEDEDDDLRSLLSGNSLGERYVSRPQHGFGGGGREGGNQNNQQHSSPELGGGNISGGDSNNNHITHLPYRDDPDDNSDNTGHIMHNATTIGNNNNALGQQHGHHLSINANPSSKRMLWILGTIILAVGFLGPSGLLWDFMEEEDDGIAGEPLSSPASSFWGVSGAAGGGGGGGVDRHLEMHGDRHHHISPARTAVDDIDAAEYVHPMMRSGSAAHEKFGNRKYRDRKKNRKRKNGGGGIKDAIHNIDKVFMDNHPAAVSTVKKKNKKKRQGLDSVAREQDDDGLLALNDDDEATTDFLPVVRANDDESLPANADALDALTYALPASDALECRASVVAFVINATDVRDECDGLRKAFDRTCSVHPGSQQGGGAVVPAAPAEEGAVVHR
eukprot:CAMPEP_0181096104 /NCGR_PEP_ID=MMETSP1071-20121207/10857_1 /TAXON_ID=35127 /ORGANISM="Thalassiosira sp., Strain NH16" /LENGTH=446 /DNA_ID=CAMNT_0023178495 /DNA_START=234 /DNA_END=1571 /DNA_ORIENTATION=+